MKVELVGHTTFTVPRSLTDSETYAIARDDRPYHPHVGDGSDLVEFAGRACYQSWNRPNPDTATNAGYLSHILDVGHFSVLEHATASFYITGVSRSLTHELVRHRHFAYSQVSQRYVDSSTADPILPPEFADDEAFVDAVQGAWEDCQRAYDELVNEATLILRERGETENVRKRARQAARCVLPNMTETKIVMTGNYRAWTHFVFMRAAAPADIEIRALAVEILRQLQSVAPHVFDHYKIVPLPDGTEVAEGPVI